MKETIISTLTSKSQTVIPKAVRQQMGLHAGDYIQYVIVGNKVEIQKLKSAKEQASDPFAAFDEWHSSSDEKAYKHLKPKR